MAKQNNSSSKNTDVRESQLMGETQVFITAPNLRHAVFLIQNTTPLVQQRFRITDDIEKKFSSGDAKHKTKQRKARDFEEEFKRCLYIPSSGGFGIPITAFRAALISACKLCNFKMTHGKITIFIEADDFDIIDGTPLIKITGTPRCVKHLVKNSGISQTSDIRARAMFDKWEATIDIKYDADTFSATDIANLLLRVGTQIGIGAGRPDSKNSAGMGWGLFKIVNTSKVEKVIKKKK